MNIDFIIAKIILPADDFDEDDEMDIRLAKIEARKRNHIERGGFLSTQ